MQIINSSKFFKPSNNIHCRLLFTKNTLMKLSWLWYIFIQFRKILKTLRNKQSFKIVFFNIKHNQVTSRFCFWPSKNKNGFLVWCKTCWMAISTFKYLFFVFKFKKNRPLFCAHIKFSNNSHSYIILRSPNQNQSII